MRLCVILVGFLLVHGGCQSGNDSSHASAESALSREVGNADLGHEAPAQKGIGPGLALDPKGLSLVDPSSGRIRLLTFGTDQKDVIAAVTRIHGRPIEQGVTGECRDSSLAFASWDDGLRLSATDGNFSGWAVSAGEPGAERHATAAGIGIGSTRAELEEAYEIRTGESSLGTEFAAAGIHGVLGGTGTDAKITSIWSGETCVFR